MLLKRTVLRIADTVNNGGLRIIHLYGGFYTKTTGLGYYIKGSIVSIVRKTKHKGKKIKRIRLGQLYRALIIRTTRELRYLDNTVVFFFKNDSLLLKRKGVFKSKFIKGPSSRLLKKKKLKHLFKSIIYFMFNLEFLIYYIIFFLSLDLWNSFKNFNAFFQKQVLIFSIILFTLKWNFDFFFGLLMLVYVSVFLLVNILFFCFNYIDLESTKSKKNNKTLITLLVIFFCYTFFYNNPSLYSLVYYDLYLNSNNMSSFFFFYINALIYSYFFIESVLLNFYILMGLFCSFLLYVHIFDVRFNLNLLNNRQTRELFQDFLNLKSVSKTKRIVKRKTNLNFKTK